MAGQIFEHRSSTVRFRARLAILSLTVALAFPHSAFALSELKQIPGQEQQKKNQPFAPNGENPDDEQPDNPGAIPMPDPLVNKAIPNAQGQPADRPVEVLSDISKIPEPVARMRELIVEAAASGDIERLRPLLGKGETQTDVSDTDMDPVDALKSLSGDPDGIEILAILLDVLSTGFVLVDKGTPDEMYVWPYFAEKPLASLTPPEKVDLFRLVTAGDFAGMQELGGYNFYRVGITPDGQWKFFVGGD